MDFSSKHGELNHDGSMRWCVVDAAYHGPLYVCRHYSADLRDELQEQWQYLRNCAHGGTLESALLSVFLDDEE